MDAQFANGLKREDGIVFRRYKRLDAAHEAAAYMNDSPRHHRVFSGRVFFDHLPKTAGTAIYTWLATELGTGSVLPTVDAAHHDVIRKHGGTYSVLCAHAHFAPGEVLDPRYVYLTCLREPVDRVISWLYFARQELKGTVHANLHRAVANFIDSDGEMLSDILVPSISNLCVAHFADLESEAASSDPVERARLALGRYDIVGFQEDLLAFASEVADLIGIERPNVIGTANKTQHRPAIETVNPALLRKICDLNQLDSALYAALREGQRTPTPSALARSATSKLARHEPTPPRYFQAAGVELVRSGIRNGPLLLRRQIFAFEFEFRLLAAVTGARIGIEVRNEQRVIEFATNNELLTGSRIDCEAGAYAAVFQLIADLPPGRYHIGIVLAQRAPARDQYLFLQEQACQFEVTASTSTDVTNLPGIAAQFALSPCVDFIPARAITAPRGNLRVVDQLTAMKARDRLTINVELSNEGSGCWKGDPARPVRLAYRWQQVGSHIITEGERSALPFGGVPEGRTICAAMDIFSPEQVGDYHLTVTLVQEAVGWFDTMGDGFQAHIFAVSVIA